VIVPTREQHTRLVKNICIAILIKFNNHIRVCMYFYLFPCTCKSRRNACFITDAANRSEADGVNAALPEHHLEAQHCTGQSVSSA